MPIAYVDHLQLTITKGEVIPQYTIQFDLKNVIHFL